MSNEKVNHPDHYGGDENIYETIKVIEAWLGKEGLKNFCLGNAIKYISRAGKKDNESEDFKKAVWYIEYIINNCE